ncbi:tail protein [Lentzea aerocolonigenes]|uniref:Tail protein n=1 Tax=Lentzea aerocolonigenes TaxID=68170 RepID=A0A0F0H4L7_LENAE|nr:phage tail sheath family protein [Lentzea aerocolonigenes]KJK49262.1 tail protein [Lentzea aerocolonigenes]
MPNYLSPGVYVQEVSSGSKPIEGVGTAVAAFVGFAEKGPFHEPTLVTNWTQFTNTFGGFTEGQYLAHSVYGYFLNGGGVAYVVRIGSDGAQQALPPVATAELTAGDGSGNTDVKASLRIKALEAAKGDVTVEVAEASEPSDDRFKLLVKQDGKVRETFDNVSLHRGDNNVVTAVREKSRLIELEETKWSPLAKRPESGVVELRREETPSTELVVSAEQYVGDAADRTGFAGLEAVDAVTMLCVPDLMAAYQNGDLDDDGLKAVQLAMIAHCELMGDRVAILDAPPGLNAQQVRTWRQDTAGYDSKYAALYWPWIKVMDPASGKPITLPPSAHVGGIWARNDNERGVHKAPANEVVRGAITLERNITRGEQDQLNPIGVNCIRAFPGQGIRVWGARTLSSDPEWRYLNVRRLFNFVEESILLSTNWVVFEPNDPKLWDTVRRVISSFLRTLWRSGALFGQTAESSFYVKCDAENNPPESRDQGYLNVEIGIAPVKPAEFIVFRISQYAEGAGVQE